MRAYLLDSNHVSSTVRRVSQVRDRILQASFQGFRFGTCIPVLFELEVGFQQTASPEAHRQRLRQLLQRVRLWPLDTNLAPLYGSIYHELKAQGRVLSQVDIMLAALARQMNLVLLAADNDFAALPDLPTENWLP